MNDLQGDRLRLAFIGMHPDRSRELMRDSSAASILDRIDRGLITVPDHARRASRVAAAARRDQTESVGISVLYREDPAFPAHLAELPDCPDLLFVKGQLTRQPGVAVVGTRRATAYGRSLARQFGAAIGRSGWPVISGLARGIDIAAHEGTVAVGQGVAVLGCGIDRWYPAGHGRMGETLVAGGGAVVSEYPPGTPPNGWRFPPRNRIISGLSTVVVVVEAAAAGGALITARLAMQQGRDVFAVPGDVDRPSSEGCNLLIRDGAWPIFSADDLVESVSQVMGDPPADGTERAATQDVALLDCLAGHRRAVDWVIETLQEPPDVVLAEIGRLEALGLLRNEGGFLTVV